MASQRVAQEHIRPVSRATLPQGIVDAIAELIMKGIWKPGDMIPSEKELAARFNVGRSTIREAVKGLAVLGVLEARAGEGSYIREPNSELLSGAFRWGLLLSERNLDDLLDVRVLVEVEGAGRAARNGTATAAAALRETLERTRPLPHDDPGLLALDNRFHTEIAEMAGNRIFASIASTIQVIVRLWHPPAYYVPETKDVTYAEHLAIARAITDRDEAAARAAMREHLLKAAARLERVMAARQPA
ncbi:MAG: FadR family transcriptional regulator [Alphaproteobacteria bacterium]|nr:FadR family transcriptional regulator [Alphaproteobacteria bacterium]